jgi:hypothetical protein
MTNLDFIDTVGTGRVVHVIGDPGLVHLGLDLQGLDRVLEVKENLKDKENHGYK